MLEWPTRRIYRQKLLARARANLREFRREKGIRENVESGTVGLFIGWLSARSMSGEWFSGMTLVAGAMGVVGGWLFVYLRTYVRFLFRAPYELDEERKEELAAHRSNLTRANERYKELQQQHIEATNKTSLHIQFKVDNDNSIMKTALDLFSVMRTSAESLSTIGYLEVHNTGARTAKCRAFISVDEGIPADQAPQHASVYWLKPVKVPYASARGESDEPRDPSYVFDCVDIEAGDKRKITVAELVLKQYTYRWAVPYWSKEGKLCDATTTGLFPRIANAKDSANVHLTVIITAEPPLAGGSQVRNIVIDGSTVREA